MEGNKLRNKNTKWNTRPESNDNWKLESKDGLFYIENTSNQHRLGKLERGESAFQHCINVAKS